MTQREQVRQSKLLTIGLIVLVVIMLLSAAGLVLNVASLYMVPETVQASSQAIWASGGEQLVFGVAETNGTPVPLKVSIPNVGDDFGALDVYLQDQHTQVLLSPFLVPSGLTATIAVTAAPGDWTINVTPTGSIVASNTIAFGQADSWWDGHVYTTSGAILTLDQSINVTYPVGTEVKVFTSNLALDGSAARIVSKVYPVPSLDFDIAELRVNMVCSTEPDDSKFCDIAALNRGVALRFYNGETGLYQNLGNAKTNGALALFCHDMAYTDKSGGGAYGVRAACKIRYNAGVTIRLRGQSGGGNAYTPLGRDELHFILQDDLTGLNSVHAILIGHVVD